MNNQNFSFTITVTPSSTSTLHHSSTPVIEMAHPLESGCSSSYYLPSPHTQECLRLSRQIGLSIESDSPLSIQISSPPPSSIKTSTHPHPITHPHSPPVLNIPTSLPHRIPKSSETEEDVIRNHLHTFMSHCQHELDILETRRRDALHLYKDTLVHDRLSEKYDKMWDMLAESRKLLVLLTE